MHNRIKNTLHALAIVVGLFVSSCTSDPITSFNRFLIDNQSSTHLFYITGSGLDKRTIEITRFSMTEIEVAVFDGDRAVFIQAEEFFTQTENDIYLLRETNGNLIEVLQLNTLGALNWEVEMVNDDTFKHFMCVTDDMLNLY